MIKEPWRTENLKNKRICPSELTHSDTSSQPPFHAAKLAWEAITYWSTSVISSILTFNAYLYHIVFLKLLKYEENKAEIRCTVVPWQYYILAYDSNTTATYLYMYDTVSCLPVLCTTFPQLQTKCNGKHFSWNYGSATVCYYKSSERECTGFPFIPMDQLFGWANFRTSINTLQMKSQILHKAHWRLRNSVY